jgi:hypothetical protein
MWQMFRPSTAQPSMFNMHRLRPCGLCLERMAVPLQACCTVCDAVTIPALVPDDVSALAA